MHRDIDAIMEDMREAHRGRSDSAPENSVAEELKQDLEEVTRFNGSKLEQLIRDCFLVNQKMVLISGVTLVSHGWIGSHEFTVFSAGFLDSLDLLAGVTAIKLVKKIQKTHDIGAAIFCAGINAVVIQKISLGIDIVSETEYDPNADTMSDSM